MSAPTVAELRDAANMACSSTTFAALLGISSPEPDTASESAKPVENIITVQRKPSVDQEKRMKKQEQDAQRRKDQIVADQYTRQFNRNCFYQFRKLPDTRKTFFGIADDAEPATAPQNE